MNRIVIAVLVTFLTGIIGLVIEYDFDIPNVSTCFVVITMEAFLMYEINKSKD